MAEPMPRAEYRADRPIVAELAAGGLVRRPPDGALLLLHETRDDRWCFPKGHVEAGETLREAARREIAEETGLAAFEIAEEIVEVHYRFYQPSRDRNVSKTVVYYLVHAPEQPVRLEPGFDAHRWCVPDDALRLVPYEADRTALRALAARPRDPAPG